MEFTSKGILIEKLGVRIRRRVLECAVRDNVWDFSASEVKMKSKGNVRETCHSEMGTRERSGDVTTYRKKLRLTRLQARNLHSLRHFKEKKSVAKTHK